SMPDWYLRTADAIIAAATRMYDRGLVNGTVGNVSARIPEGMLITPTRRHPEELAAADLVRVHVGSDGRRDVPSGASREWRMHAAIYMTRRDLGAIAHTHSPYATARSFDPRPLEMLTEEREYLGID